MKKLYPWACRKSELTIGFCLLAMTLTFLKATVKVLVCLEPGMAVHTFNPALGDRDRQIFVSWTPVWFIQWVFRQPSLHSKTLSQKINKYVSSIVKHAHFYKDRSLLKFKQLEWCLGETVSYQTSCILAFSPRNRYTSVEVLMWKGEDFIPSQDKELQATIDSWGSENSWFSNTKWSVLKPCAYRQKKRTQQTSISIFHVYVCVCIIIKKMRLLISEWGAMGEVAGRFSESGGGRK